MKRMILGFILGASITMNIVQAIWHKKSEEAKDE